MAWFIPLYVLVVVLMHELGHYIAAKVQGLIVEGFNFELKPLPHFYVSVIDDRLTMKQRLIFLIGGSLMTLLLLILFLISGIDNRYLFFILICQTLLDFNPFYSDYVVAIMSYIYRDYFKKNETNENLIEELKERYMFSTIWYIHLILWGIMIILLLSPKFINPYNITIL